MEDKLFDVADGVKMAMKKSRKLKEGMILAEWENIVGKMARESQPIYLKDGVLKINVRSPLFHQEFLNKKEILLKKINDFFDDEIVTSLDIRLGETENFDFDNKEEEVVEEKQKNIENSQMGIIEKVEYLRKLAEKREEYLLSHGHKKCKICGMLFKPENNSLFCCVCLEQKKDREYNKEKKL